MAMAAIPFNFFANLILGYFYFRLFLFLKNMFANIHIYMLFLQT